MKPKKNLGQCFLINKHASARIASLLELTPSDSVLEIGGGRGDLTTHLLDSGAQVTVVELDMDLIEPLHERFRDCSNFTLIGQDILTLDPTQVGEIGQQLKLAGNIPYHLSSPIMEWLIRNRSLFDRAVFTLQKELADRIVASPGGKQFGSLTVFVQMFYQARKEFDLKPGSFFPPPKVNSAVVTLSRLDEPLAIGDELDEIRRLTRSCFRWRRKQIIRILREEYELEVATVEELLGSLQIPGSVRPEQLAVVDFVSLARKLKCERLDTS